MPPTRRDQPTPTDPKRDRTLSSSWSAEETLDSLLKGDGVSTAGSRTDERNDEPPAFVHPFDRDEEEAIDPTDARRVDPQEREAFWVMLADVPWKFDFFAAVRRLEALYPELPGFGASHRASEDPVRFSQHPFLTFAPCTMPECRPATATAPTRLFVNFLGMLGPHGPLPLHLTEYAYHRELHNKDHTFVRFLDVFNHRMVSLFYRAWASCSMPASFDRTPPRALRGDVKFAEREKILTSEKDRYPVYVGALFGQGMPTLRHREAVPDLAKLHFAGRLVGQQTGPEGLCAILGSYFKVPVSVREFVGRYVNLPPQYRTQLGGGPRVMSDPDALSAATLGQLSGGAMVCGTHIWDAQGAFEVSLGPMNFETFAKFIPGSGSERRLRSWIRIYLGEEFAWSVKIVIKASEVPKLQLVSRAKAGSTSKQNAQSAPQGARLGWTTWLRSQPETRDRDDLRVRSEQPRAAV